mgnify:CR=1 FL=1
MFIIYNFNRKMCLYLMFYSVFSFSIIFIAVTSAFIDDTTITVYISSGTIIIVGTVINTSDCCRYSFCLKDAIVSTQCV